MHYYETYETADGIDLKGSCTATAHDTLEDAIEYAEANNLNYIAEIGGSWDEWEKCDFCGEWYLSTELNEYGDCDRCIQAMNDHGGYRPRIKEALVLHLGEWTECKITCIYPDKTCRIEIPQYDYKGRRNGEWCTTVDKDELRFIH